MSSGSDALNIASGGFLNSALGSIGNPLPANAVIDFLAGNDAVNNDGLFRLRPSSIGGSVLTLQNLELFNNSGIIVLGTSTDSSRPPSASDRTADDVLLMPGTDFVGLTGSRIALDVELDSSGGQAACVTPTLVADCLGLAGGSTAGVTLLTVSDATATNRFAGYQTVPITLIDVNGGASAAGHFAIDPNSDGYDARHGGVLKAGHFFYALSYDDANQRHALYSIPDVELMEFTAVGQAIQGVWQTSTTGLFDRQAQARAGEEDAGIWLRASVERSDRDLIQTFTTGAGVGFDFDTGYEQETLSLTGGVDLLRSEGQHGGYSLGASLGYIDSRVEFPGTAAEISLEGGTLGLYGGYATGPLFVDATVNGLLLMMDIDDPAVGLPGPLPVREKVRGVGAQVEGGWRTEFGNLYVEPLLAASYVQTRFDQFTLAEVKLDFELVLSHRLGVHVDLDVDFRLPLLGQGLR